MTHKQHSSYSTWCSMRRRCLKPKDPSYSYYGGRGITICARWSSFKCFAEDMGPRPSLAYSIGRIDNNGNYEPTNCRWETATQQANNRRSSRLLTLHGETRTVANWARHIGIDVNVLEGRIAIGWTDEHILTTPVRDRFRMITFNGETKTLTAWSTSLGIKPHTLIARLDANWPLERALVVSQQNKRMLTFNGRTMMIGDWAKELDLTLTCLIGRFDRGWSTEKALSTPAVMTNTRKRKLQGLT